MSTRHICLSRLSRLIEAVPAALRSLALVLMALLALPGPAAAHEATMVDLRVREIASGDFVWSWGVPAKGRPVSEDLTISWPEQCQPRGQALRCGARNLTGTVAIDGVGRAYSAVILRVSWANGQTQVRTLTDAMPKVHLFGGGQDTRGAQEVVQTYGVLGIEHILTGWDHLMFVLSLLLLVGFKRRLIGTVTAFTAAHSLTLAASALGWLVLRSAPVEACIALSIVLVCGEVLRTRQTLSRRWPALVAFVFGLVHGLGFAGALKEIGLPEDHVSMALLGFNLGVEAGQLLVIGVLWLAFIGGRRLVRAGGLGFRRAGPVMRPTAADPHGALAAVARAAPGRWERVLVYGMGSVGAYWAVQRMAAIVWG
jgi:hydrogenase/urease accessory protein HupE